MRLCEQVLTGGKPHSLGGLFFEPTVLEGCNASMLVHGDETFGPVCSIFKFKVRVTPSICFCAFGGVPHCLPAVVHESY
jgi:hypothetical protein